MRIFIICLALAMAALTTVLIGAYRMVLCSSAVVSTSALPAAFAAGTKAIIEHSTCRMPIIRDRWTVTLVQPGRTDEIFRSSGIPRPVRVEAKGQGTSRRLLIHTEPRSLDGTAGVVEVPIGADGRPTRR